MADPNHEEDMAKPLESNHFSLMKTFDYRYILICYTKFKQCSGTIVVTPPTHNQSAEKYIRLFPCGPQWWLLVVGHASQKKTLRTELQPP